MVLNTYRRRDREKCQRARVWLDGQEVTARCWYVDVRRGRVRLYRRDQNGRFYKGDDGGLAGEERRGHVRLVVGRLKADSGAAPIRQGGGAVNRLGECSTRATPPDSTRDKDGRLMPRDYNRDVVVNGVRRSPTGARIGRPPRYRPDPTAEVERLFRVAKARNRARMTLTDVDLWRGPTTAASAVDASAVAGYWDGDT